MDDPHEKTRLIIFAREPQNGQVKTRLLKGLRAPEVTRLYKAFIRDILNAAELVRCTEKAIYYTGPKTIPFLSRFRKKIALFEQKGKNLGERMYDAFKESRKLGYEKTVIIGTDTPDIRPVHIQNAFRRLSDHDIVLGPSRDGGYYLLGLKRPYRALFDDIPWGTQHVLPLTLKKAKWLKKKVIELRPLEDIDTMSDLEKFVTKRLGRTNAINSRNVVQNLKF